MNCPSCGAPMHPDGETFKCDYCKSVFVPDKNDEGVRVLGEASGQNCPVCAIPLMQATLARLSILSCTKCRGMLVPMGAFQVLIDQMREEHPDLVVAEPPVNPAELRRVIACPKCRSRMEAHFYAGPGRVVIDSCETCLLIWLDHGELSRIAHAP
jgi:Zn-finger nucleic acid-binding protein